MENCHCPWRTADPGMGNGHKDQVGDVGRDPTHNLIPAHLYIHQYQPGHHQWPHCRQGSEVYSPDMDPREQLMEGTKSCCVYAQFLGKQVSVPLISHFGKDPELGRSPRTPWELPQTDTAFLPPSGCLHPRWHRGQLSPSPGSGSARQVQTPGPQGEVWPSSMCRARWERAQDTITITKSKAQASHGLALPSPESGTANHGDLAHCHSLSRRLRLQPVTQPGLSPWKPNKHHPCVQNFQPIHLPTLTDGSRS